MRWRWLRGVLAAAILAYSGWQLWSAWTGLEHSGMVEGKLSLRLAPLLGSMLTGGLAFAVLALISGAGARAARLGGGGGRFYLGWLRVWFQGYFYRYVPGKLMLVAERARLGERLGVPKAASVMLVVWESLLLLAGAGLLAGLGLLALPRPEGGTEPVQALAVGGLAGGCLLGSLALGPLLGALARWFPSLGRKMPGLVLEVSPGAQVLLVMGNALAWALLGASFALCAAALPSETLPTSPDRTLLVVWFVASYVGGQVASVAPAGLGVREGLLVAGLGSVVPAPVVLAWAVAHRIALSLVELLLVSSALLIPLPEASAGATLRPEEP